MVYPRAAAGCSFDCPALHTSPAQTHRSTPFAFRDMGRLEAHGQTRRCIYARWACNGGYAVACTRPYFPRIGPRRRRIFCSSLGHYDDLCGLPPWCDGTDYYPRLIEVIHDKVAAVQLMNDQTQLGLAISGPVLLLLIGLAPWVITLLYSAKFDPAVTLLQWQTVGNVFKIASSALGFSIVAAGRAKTFFFVELSFNIVFLGMVFVFMPHFGLEATAYAFVLGYLVHMIMVYLLARRTLRFPLAVILCQPAGSAHEPWSCTAGAGTDGPTCSSHCLANSCRGDGALWSAHRTQQSRKARPPPHAVVWNFCEARLADPVSGLGT